MKRRASIVVVLLVAIVVAAFFWPRTGDAAQGGLSVRFPEGTTHGFLHLLTPGGKHLASGDQLQVPRRGGIETRIVFHFPDSSVYDEVVAFTQDNVFEMQYYRVVQRGPAFPYDMDARLTRNGKYVVTSKSRKDGKETHDSGTLELPPDVYNGMMILAAKNLAPSQSATVHMVAFTPKPQIVRIVLTPVGTRDISVGNHKEQAREYRMHPQIGGVKGFFAKLLGKIPPDGHAWIAVDEVPAFLRFEGPMFGGPVVRIDLTTPELK